MFAGIMDILIGHTAALTYTCRKISFATEALDIVMVDATPSETGGPRKSCTKMNGRQNFID